jgi:hypothetical protein
VGFLAFSTPILDARNALMRLFCFLWLIILAWIAAPELRGQNTGFKYLEVTVVGPDGKPMADVPVEISIDQMKIPMPTDSEGKVGMNVPADKNAEVEVRVKQEGYTAMGVGWRGEKVPESVTIPLSKGVTFGGIVHNERGQPVEGTEVSGQMVWKNRYGLVNDGEVAPYLDGELAKTDKDGRWQCSMGPEGDAKFRLSFSRSGFLVHNPDDEANFEELKKLKRIDVLDQGVSLAGEVLLPDGRPLPQTMVQVTKLENGGTSMWNEIANAEAKFRFERLPKGPAILSVQTAKYAPLKMPIDVQPEMEPLSVKLENGKQIQLKLVNEAGEPVVGSRVEIVDWRFHRDDLELGKKSDADDQGLWQGDLIPSGEMTYQVSAQGYRTAKHELVASGDLQTITLKPPVKVTGRVIDKATGDPIKKFKLIGFCIHETDQKRRYVEAFGSVELTTPGDYTFESAFLCDECIVSCSAEGYKGVGSRAITPDEDKVVWEFELERDPEAKP